MLYNGFGVLPISLQNKRESTSVDLNAFEYSYIFFQAPIAQATDFGPAGDPVNTMQERMLSDVDYVSTSFSLLLVVRGSGQYDWMWRGRLGNLA